MSGIRDWKGTLEIGRRIRKGLSEEVTLEQSLECSEEASQGRVGVEEQHVKRPQDVNWAGAFKDRKKAVGKEGRTRAGRATSHRPPWSWEVIGPCSAGTGSFQRV